MSGWSRIQPVEWTPVVAQVVSSPVSPGQDVTVIQCRVQQGENQRPNVTYWCVETLIIANI